MANTGKIKSVIGAVCGRTVRQRQQTPESIDTLEVKRENGDTLVLEVQQHTGEKTAYVRSLWMVLKVW